MVFGCFGCFGFLVHDIRDLFHGDAEFFRNILLECSIEVIPTHDPHLQRGEVCEQPSGVGERIIFHRVAWVICEVLLRDEDVSRDVLPAVWSVVFMLVRNLMQ